MKKIVLGLLIVALLAISIPVFGGAGDPVCPTPAMNYGMPKMPEGFNYPGMDGGPQNYDIWNNDAQTDDYFIPLRSAFESLGYNVDWSEDLNKPVIMGKPVDKFILLQDKAYITIAEAKKIIAEDYNCETETVVAGEGWNICRIKVFYQNIESDLETPKIQMSGTDDCMAAKYYLEDELLFSEVMVVSRRIAYGGYEFQ